MERKLKKPKALSEVILPYESYGHDGPWNHDIGIYNIVEHLSWMKNIL